MKKLLVMLLLTMSAVVFTVGCVTSPEHILTVKQLEELLETKTAEQIFEEDLKNGNWKTNNDIFCIDAAGLSFLLEKGLDVNAKFETVTVLHVAAYWGDLGLVKELIGKGADVNAKDKSGWTVLHVAAESGNLDLVKYLVEEKNLDVNAKDEDGWTVLHDAARSGNLDLVKYLVEEKNLDVNAKTDGGWTVLHSAAGNSHLEVVKYLVEEKNLDVNAKDDDGWTVLHSAACHGTLEVVEYLVKKGADVNAKHDLGATPLRVTRKPEIRSYLCEVAEWNFMEKKAREKREYKSDTISSGNAPAAPSDRSSQ